MSASLPGDLESPHSVLSWILFFLVLLEISTLTPAHPPRCALAGLALLSPRSHSLGSVISAPPSFLFSVLENWPWTEDPKGICRRPIGVRVERLGWLSRCVEGPCVVCALR